MAGIKLEVLRILCSLSIVMAFGVVLAVPGATLLQESLTAAPDTLGSRRKGPSFQELMVESRSRDNDDGEGNVVDEIPVGEGDFGSGIVEGDGGCAHIPGEPTTAGEGHQSAFGLVFLFPIYLLVNRFCCEL